MEISAILALVTQLVPVATQLIQGLSNAKSSGVYDQLNLITTLTPVVNELVTRIELIRAQTEDDYPKVWADVRTDWMDQLAKWNALQQ